MTLFSQFTKVVLSSEANILTLEKEEVHTAETLISQLLSQDQKWIRRCINVNGFINTHMLILVPPDHLRWPRTE